MMQSKFNRASLFSASTILATALLTACSGGGNNNAETAANADNEAGFNRGQIRIVGSSTVYPFSSFVAEEFGSVTDFPTPVVESTGSGGGMKLFCGGIGEDTPDITNASRPMKKKELKMCHENGVTDITQVKIGYDGIVFAQSNANDAFEITLKQLAFAVLAEVPVDGKLVANPYQNWNQLDSSLPDRKIQVFGPPTSSGTRDAFEELVLQKVTKKIDIYGGKYDKVRQDGVFIPSGENDNLIVQKLDRNRDAFGIFGYSFLEENSNSIQASNVDGVTPEADAISSGEYPVSRSLFFYVKNHHENAVNGLYDFVDTFVKERMIGPKGALKRIGLISLPEAEREAVRANVKARKVVTEDALH